MTITKTHRDFSKTFIVGEDVLVRYPTVLRDTPSFRRYAALVGHPTVFRDGEIIILNNQSL